MLICIKNIRPEKTKQKSEGKKEDLKVTVHAEVVLEKETRSIDEASLLELDTSLQAKGKCK